jgi:threonine aldolase
MFDLRSDTVTRPSAAMRRAMAEAEVGDDVYREDPTVQRLEERCAELLGKEAALFVPSGTMANQIALKLHTRPGDEVIVGEGTHCAYYESGAAAAFGGVQFAAVGQGGFFGPDELEAAIKPRAYWCPRSRLVVVENTHNRGGGRVLSLVAADAVAAAARRHDLALHLDGARLWNAAAALGCEPHELAQPFDTVSVCFSKGLGAPIGSALCGSAALIEDALRLRKMLGGGMRQAGMIAAGALYALENNRARVIEDHRAATRLGLALAEIAGVTVGAVETNIVNVDVAHAERAVAAALGRGVLISAVSSSRVRLVTHLDVAGEGFDACVEALVTSFREAVL